VVFNKGIPWEPPQTFTITITRATAGERRHKGEVCAISNQARFRREQITIAGKATERKRTADSGNVLTYSFCPVCGSMVDWENTGVPDVIAVAISALADPSFPPRTISV
jgi:hypothetical protein